MVNLSRATGPQMCSERHQRAPVPIPYASPFPCPLGASKRPPAAFAWRIVSTPYAALRA
jgi:hypothetical protein